MTKPEQLGDVGELYFCSWARQAEWPIDFVSTNQYVDGFDNSDDVEIHFRMRCQVKTKTAPTERKYPWVCTRTGNRGTQRWEHGFEAFRLENYLQNRVWLFFVEHDGTILHCDPQANEPRFGCHTDCPQFRKPGHASVCDFFVYFDRNLMHVCQAALHDSE